MAKYLYTNIRKYTDELLKKFPPPPPPPTYGGSSSGGSSKRSSGPYHTKFPQLYDESFVRSHTQTMSGAKIATGKRIVAELMSRLHITRIQAAAIAGNWYAESGFVPSSLQYTTGGGYTLAQAISGGYGKKGYGFAQWTYKTRQINLNQFLDSKYGAGNGATRVMTEEDNIGFAVWELKSPAFATIFNTIKSFQFSIKGEHHVLVDATSYVMEHYEQPFNQSINKQAERIGYAKQLL